MANWSSLLAPATESDLKRTAPRGGKTIGTKFAEAAEKQLAELEKPEGERAKRLWWFRNAEGKLVFRPRHGSNYVSLNGSNAFVVPSGEETDLIEIISGMAADAREGKLDAELNEAAKKAASRGAAKPTGRGRKAK